MGNGQIALPNLRATHYYDGGDDKGEKMTTKEAVLSLIKNYGFYYIEYPDNVKEDIWKDGNGDLQYMQSMELDHLKACIRTVEKSISYLKESHQKIEVTDIVKPFAEEKLNQLKNAFQRKINI